MATRESGGKSSEVRDGGGRATAGDVGVDTERGLPLEEEDGDWPAAEEASEAGQKVARAAVEANGARNTPVAKARERKGAKK